MVYAIDFYKQQSARMERISALVNNRVVIQLRSEFAKAAQADLNDPRLGVLMQAVALHQGTIKSLAEEMRDEKKGIDSVDFSKESLSTRAMGGFMKYVARSAAKQIERKHSDLFSVTLPTDSRGPFIEMLEGEEFHPLVKGAYIRDEYVLFNPSPR